ncbi:putative secreted protein (Por secretion system target) [Breznakibacter xylanolyticus]|uniref:Putative secreted protein (Por secretion system target) n=2 Tax=Breznakibacter xylanolyticus TaxID=990 RepID=A0A2W7NXA3_9BACT|nr:putative secreted protein (Por secretion system target) [Breznakibacter xylanolyticus]
MRLIVFLLMVIMTNMLFAQTKQKFGGQGNTSLPAVGTSETVLSSRSQGAGAVVAFPSPFKSSFTLESPETSEIKSVAVVNILGKKVPVSVDLMSTRAVVTFDSGVPDGIYLCKVTLEREILTIRMVKSVR